jgi:hypothetical protein
MIVIVQAECKSYRVMEASTKISKEGQECVVGSGSLQTAHVRVNPKLQRPQDVGDARNVKHLLWEAAGNEWSQPKREASPQEESYLSLLELTSQHHMPRPGSTGLFPLLGFSLAFVPFFPPFLLEWRYLLCALFCGKYVVFFLILQGFAVRVCLESQRRL